METAVFGGGCFWCTEAIYQSLKGVASVLPGYAGGTTANPTYEDIHGSKTGHAEVIKIEFDPSVVKFTDLLEVLFAVHDPTTLNRQGNDVGEEYRSIILYTSEEQKAQAEKFIQDAQSSFEKPIVTQIRPLEKFYEAEDYHRNFYKNNPRSGYCQVIIDPKVAKFKQKFASLIK